MSSATLSKVLLRQVPAPLMAGIRSGEIKVYGSIIRSVASGKIVGHLQETSGFAKLGGIAVTAGSSAPLAGAGLAADLIGQGVNYVQNEQIKAALDVVQNLQVANLALGVVGIGVSVAGFAVLSAKINRIETSVDAMADRLTQLARGVDWLRHDRIAEDFARLRTVAEQLDEGWTLTDPSSQWRQVATEAHSLANIFERRATGLTTDPADLLAVEPFVDALALATSLRVSARLASGEDIAAGAAADEGAKCLIALGEHVSLSAAALRQMITDKAIVGSSEWGVALNNRAETLRPVIALRRQREMAAVSTSLTLAELRRQLIPGRAWLESARSETDEALICLLPIQPPA